jgi:hypothetical protein
MRAESKRQILLCFCQPYSEFADILDSVQFAGMSAVEYPPYRNRAQAGYPQKLQF